MIGAPAGGPESGAALPAVEARGGGGRGIHALAVAVALWTLVLLFVGGLVTSKEAGLCVPDWPLSNGSINPPRWLQTDNLREEHAHRLLGWVLGMLIIALAVGIQRTDPRRWMRRLGWIALGAVCVQGVLGGYFRVVLLMHRMAIVHGVIGQGIFCLMVALALFTSRGWLEAPPPEPVEGARRLHRRALSAVVAVYVQVLVGALVRHSRVGHLVEYVWPHMAWGVVAAILGFAAAAEALGRHGSRPPLARPALVLGAGLLLQVLLGLGTYFADVDGVEEIIRPPYQFWTATAHQAAGAVVLAAAVVLYLRARRLLAEPGSPGVAASAAVSPGPIPVRGGA